MIDGRSALERAADLRILYRLAAGAEGGAFLYPAESERFSDLYALAWIGGTRQAPWLAPAGAEALGVARFLGELPGGVLKISATATGATLWQYADAAGVGRRVRVGAWRKHAGVLDYAPAFCPVGYSGRAAADAIAQAVDFAGGRVLELEAAGVLA